MPAGQYAVLRYIPDPARDEPINVGLIANGPAGAVYKTNTEALERVRKTDPFIDRDTLHHLTDHMEQLISGAVQLPSATGWDRVEPWQPEFLAAICRRVPERFVVGQARFIDYADESLDAMTTAAAELVGRLVKPVAGTPVFVRRDPQAPAAQLKRHLRALIKSGLIREEPPVQGGLSKRLRHPDFRYELPNGESVIVDTVKLTSTLPWLLSQTADAVAFQLLDIVGDNRRRTHVIAVVDSPEIKGEAFTEAVQSLRAVAEEVILDGRDIAVAQKLASRMRKAVAPD
jgi:hypothetical protein